LVWIVIGQKLLHYRPSQTSDIESISDTDSTKLYWKTMK